jgi:hypothetical protein
MIKRLSDPEIVLVLWDLAVRSGLGMFDALILALLCLPWCLVWLRLIDMPQSGCQSGRHMAN